MTCNFLILNSDKTEVILLGPEHRRDQLSGDVVSVDGIALASNNTVKQWSPNYGPRAGFGPPPHLDRPPKQYQRRVPIYYFFHLARCR